MDANSPLHALLRATILHALAQAIERGLPLGPISVREDACGLCGEFRIFDPPPDVELRDVEQAILDKATGKGWLTVKRLANLIECREDYTRKAVANLVRLGMMERGPDGVRVEEAHPNG